MNKLVVLEKPDTAYLEYKGRYGNEKVALRLHPYSDPTLLDVAHVFGVRLPFASILSPDQGSSKCEKCGAVYSGYQPICTRRVRFVSLEDVTNSWQKKDVVSEAGVVGGRFVEQHTWSKTIHEVKSVKEDQCSGSLKWEHAAAWEKQVQFFSMLDLIKHLSDSSPFAPFSESFLPGVRQHLEAQLIFKIITELSTTLVSHRGALEQIAQKMNSAGQSLSF